jgi:hypothetical protein
MSTSLELILTITLAEIIPAAIFLYDAYWSLEIRKALASPIYRSHALWQGAVSITIGMAIFATYTNGLVISTLLVVYYTVFFVVVFAFIDSTIKVARRSDPLLRPILKWETIRIAGWCSIGALTIVNSFSDEFYLLVHPLILGTGSRFFGDVRKRTSFQLLSRGAFDNGVILLRYIRESQSIGQDMMRS